MKPTTRLGELIEALQAMRKPRDDGPLVPKMRAIADRGHPRALELRARALDLEQAIEVLMRESAEPAETKKMVRAWARARRLWCQVSGEPLL